MTNDQVYEILKYYSLDLGSTGRDNDYGHGMPCFKDYSECTCNCENCDKIYCFGCSCATCKYHEPQPKTLTNIEITQMPNKTVYEEGEKFDPTGMEVTATYSDGSRENINNYNCFPITALTTNHTHITVTYTENGRTVTAKVQITVISNGNNTSDDDNNSNNNQGNTNQNNNSQTNTNQNNQNNNNQTNNNQVSINQNNNLVNKTNTTAKDGKIAQTGVETYIIPIIIISIIGAIGFIKYKQYRDI